MICVFSFSEPLRDRAFRGFPCVLVHIDWLEGGDTFISPDRSKRAESRCSRSFLRTRTSITDRWPTNPAAGHFILIIGKLSACSGETICGCGFFLGSRVGSVKAGTVAPQLAADDLSRDRSTMGLTPPLLSKYGRCFPLPKRPSCNLHWGRIHSQPSNVLGAVAARFTASVMSLRRGGGPSGPRTPTADLIPPEFIEALNGSNFVLAWRPRGTMRLIAPRPR